MQGDRCQKSLDHEGVHEGHFTIWQDGKFREEKFESHAPKRMRHTDKVLRQLERHQVALGGAGKKWLDGVIQENRKNAGPLSMNNQLVAGRARSG
jgi:hypothetical protein